MLEQDDSSSSAGAKLSDGLEMDKPSKYIITDYPLMPNPSSANSHQN